MPKPLWLVFPNPKYPALREMTRFGIAPNSAAVDLSRIIPFLDGSTWPSIMRPEAPRLTDGQAVLCTHFWG